MADSVKKAAARLEQMLQTDQQFRHELSQLNTELNQDKSAALWVRQHKIDRQNQLALAQIINVYGWPSQSLFGEKAALAAFLIVQHAPLAFQEKYLPLLQRAAQNNEASKAWLAFLIDRIRLYHKEPQLYGSQLRPNSQTGKLELYPLEDAAEVDVRRAEMALEPLTAYLVQFGVEDEETD